MKNAGNNHTFSDWADAVHLRWLKLRRYHARADANVWGQCYDCRHYMRLKGLLGADWGVCTNHESEFDSLAMFEHDGCPEYEESNDSP